MDAILLKPKPDNPQCKDNFVVFDEVVQGILSGTLFVPAFTGADKGMRIISIPFLIENYLFPEKQGQPQARFLHFFRGYDPILFDEIEWYEDESIEINKV